MQAQEVIERLERIPPAPVVEAALLLIQMQQEPVDPRSVDMIELQPRIEAAMAALDDQVAHTGKLVERCKSLTSRASKSVTGF